MSLVLSELDQEIGIITLNNPEKRNCLSHTLIQDFWLLAVSSG